MKLFECQFCGQTLYFENTRCESCGHRLGYLASAQQLSALEPLGGAWRALGGPDGPYRFCANAEYDACNWLIGTHEPDLYCLACRHNQMIPDLSLPHNVERWRKLESAKHRLFYTLLKLGLPLKSRTESRDGLAFEFLTDPAEGTSQPAIILTGHDNGLITINIAEADDAERERRRHEMDEPYRTLLGHFRHEVGHYFWNVLTRDDANIDALRKLFGDERQDYGAALRAHYGNGPPPDWQNTYISAYASSHPWEDFAETWAHYLHIVDSLETASSFGFRVEPRVRRGVELAAAVDFDPYDAPEFDRLIKVWTPLTLAVNSLNRSMGQPDLYPFVLSPTVVQKLRFVHQRIHPRAAAPTRRKDAESPATGPLDSPKQPVAGVEPG